MGGITMKEISGDTRVFVVINTTEYNNDGRWGVTTVAFNELESVGFHEEDVKRIDEILVGEILTDWDFTGVIVIRIA